MGLGCKCRSFSTLTKEGSCLYVSLGAFQSCVFFAPSPSRQLCFLFLVLAAKEIILRGVVDKQGGTGGRRAKDRIRTSGQSGMDQGRQKFETFFF